MTTRSTLRNTLLLFGREMCKKRFFSLFHNIFHAMAWPHTHSTHILIHFAVSQCYLSQFYFCVKKSAWIYFSLSNLIIFPYNYYTIFFVLGYEIFKTEILRYLQEKKKKKLVLFSLIFSLYLHAPLLDVPV